MPYKFPDALRPLLAEQTIVGTDLEAVMQRVADATRAGYSHFVEGTVERTKIAKLIAKFQARYPGLIRNRKHAYRLAKAGEQRTKFIALYPRNGDCRWWLLTDLPDQAEPWAEVAKARPSVLNYELRRHTRPGAAEPAWTWALTRTAKDKLSDYLVWHVRHPSKAGAARLAAFIESTRFWPGFAGIRADRRQLAKLTTADWKRHHRHSEPPPQWPPLRYARRIRTR